jgi:protoheme IX farnesyltransferase
MSTVAREADRTFGLVGDYAALLKLRIASFVGLAAFVGGLAGAGPEVAVGSIVEASIWVTLAAGAASVFNQVLERDTDHLMERTRNRPLPAGRIGTRDAILFGTLLAVVSIAALGFRFHLLAAALVLATLFAYVAVYTPLKRVSSLNTVIGALPGAAPPLIGYAAFAGDVSGWGWAVFAILFVWQFPHFMAIAWLYRHDYARAGMRMLPVETGGERVAGKAAMMYGLVILPVVLIPVLSGDAGLIFSAGALFLGLVYCAAALRFARRQNRGTARVLLLVSLIYLPLVLLLVVLDPVTGVSAAHFGR